MYFFPSFAGVFCINNKNAIFCNVSKKGAVEMQTYKLKNEIIKHKNIPILRGIEYIIFCTYYFFVGLTKYFQNIKKINYSNNKIVVFFSLILFSSIFTAFFFLGLLPNEIGFAISPTNHNLFLKNFCIGLIKCFIFFALIFLISFIPTIRAIWRFNTAGNLVLSKQKNYPLNYFNVFFTALLLDFFVVSLLGVNLNFGWKLLFNIFILFLCFSFSFEICNLAQNKNYKILNLWIVIISSLSTFLPNKTELQVANGAYYEGVLMSENNEREIIKNTDLENTNFALILADVKEQLLKNNILDKNEAEWLIANCLKCKKLDLKFVKSVNKTQIKEIKKALERRLKGEPIDKIFGFTEFYGLEIKVNQKVLTPRQETEILVENCLKNIDNQKLNILDLCTGSGAIAISLAKNTNCCIWGVDISDDAIEIAKLNAQNNKVKVIFKKSDLFSKIKSKKFDFIISNPPYLKTDEIALLDKEVKDFDPIIALDGGLDGLYFYKKIAEESPKHLTKNGKLFLEIGENQASKVKKLLTVNFINVKILKDYCGKQRIIIATKK